MTFSKTLSPNIGGSFENHQNILVFPLKFEFWELFMLTNVETVLFILGVFLNLTLTSKALKLQFPSNRFILTFQTAFSTAKPQFHEEFSNISAIYCDVKRLAYFCKQPFKMKVNKLRQLKFKFEREH